MPPKTKYNQEDIINTAFNLVRNNGWQNCTARSIAAELGSSTMPIYSYVDSMADLKEKILQKALDLLLTYQTRVKTDIDFLDMGVGYILFAKEEKNLFRLMFKETVDEHTSNENSKNENLSFEPFQAYALETLIEHLSNSKVLTGFSREEKEKIMYQSWIFSHGLAGLLNSGPRLDLDETGIIETLREFGKSIIEGSKLLRNSTDTVS